MKAITGTAQGTHVDFAFHTLGWYEFQHLCAAILREVLGQTVRIYSEGNDRGRDAAFCGAWVRQKNESLDGAFVAQIKFSRDKVRPLVSSLFTKELPKIRALHKDGLCDHYIVLTNHVTTAPTAAKIEKEIREAVPGLKSVVVHGPNDLTQWIRESSRLRMLVPRVYGIGDVSLLLSDRARRQGAAILKTIGGRLKTIVPTGAYQKAAEALAVRGFVILIGGPMVGKTTIGYALALAAADHFDREVFTPATPAEFKEHFDPHHPHRFYWIDDAFGEIIYNRSAALDWNRYFSAMAAAVEAGCKIVFTTRNYIWQEARRDLKRSAFPPLDHSQVLVEVEKLTRLEKEKILYNHLRLGFQPKSFKKAAKPFCKALAALDEFLPESARRLADAHFTGRLEMTRPSLERFFKEPLPLLIESIEQLSPKARALLAIMFAKGGFLVSPIEFDEQDARVAASHGATISEIMPEFQHLEESFVRQSVDFGGNVRYVFSHPTMREALADIFSRNTEWLEIYLLGARMVDVVQEATCGAALRGARVVVPPALFTRFLKRFVDFRKEHWQASFTPQRMPYYAEPQRFLAYRCSREFLELALQTNPELSESGMRYVPCAGEPWLDLLAKLNEFGILPDALRSEAVERLIGDADDDLSFFEDDELLGLFSDEERGRLTLRVAKHAHNLEQLADRIADDIDATDDVENEFENFFSYCETIKKVFPDDDGFARLADDGIEYAHSLIEALEEERSTPSESDRDDDAVVEPVNDDAGDRDIFEDVDDDN